jgi:hypothetical protein
MTSSTASFSFSSGISARISRRYFLFLFILQKKAHYNQHPWQLIESIQGVHSRLFLLDTFLVNFSLGRETLGKLQGVDFSGNHLRLIFQAAKDFQ